MQIRTCKGCNGAGLVHKVPNGMGMLQPAILEPEISVCICDQCGASRREIKHSPLTGWQPHPREHIDI